METEDSKITVNDNKQALLDILSNKHTITDKINFWLEIRASFQDSDVLISYLSIPPNIYDTYFFPFTDKAEYSYWHIKEYSKFWFEQLLKENKILQKLNSDMAQELIKIEVDKINEIETKAKELLNSRQIDIFENYSPHSAFEKYIECLRVTSNYYDIHFSKYTADCNNMAPVVAYAKHILFKNYLLEKLDISKIPIAIKEVEGKKNLPKKPKTKDLHSLKFANIRLSVETAWLKETNKTEERLKKIYLDKRKKYSCENKVELSQLNREIKDSTGGFEELKEYIIKIYGQFV